MDGKGLITKVGMDAIEAVAEKETVYTYQLTVDVEDLGLTSEVAAPIYELELVYHRSVGLLS